MKKMTKKNNGAPLGIIANSASANSPVGKGENAVSTTPINHTGATTDKAMDNMLVRFALQSVARRLLRGHRVGQCLRKIIPTVTDVKIVKSSENHRTSYRNLIRCGLLWACPVCAATITERRAKELQTGVANWHNQDGFVIFATYTAQHSSKASLSETLDILQTALRRFKSGRAYQSMIDEFGIVGTVRAIEITYGDNGWHPHIHELVFCLPMSKRSVKRYIEAARARWIVSLRSVGGDGIPNKAYDAKTADGEIYDYIAKYGHQPIGTGWTIEREMVKAPAKIARRGGVTPFQMLETADGDSRFANLFTEYVATMHGTRQLVWSKGMRERLGLEDESTDEKLADDGIDETKKLIYTIAAADWYSVLFKSKFNGEVRAELLRLAMLGKIEAIESIIRRSYE
jgi:hypothetical protein